nr:MAG TPA: hypothetical protein [Caudoviricetes sp.]
MAILSESTFKVDSFFPLYGYRFGFIFLLLSLLFSLYEQ